MNATNLHLDAPGGAIEFRLLRSASVVDALRAVFLKRYGTESASVLVYFVDVLGCLVTGRVQRMRR